MNSTQTTAKKNKIQWNHVSELKNKASVSKFETKYHCSIPSDLKACIMKYNAGTPVPSLIDFRGNRDKVFGALLSYNTNDLDNIYEFVELFQTNNGSTLSMIPFGIDPAGNFFCVKDKKIVFYDHETERVLPICSTFTEFLNMLHN